MDAKLKAICVRAEEPIKGVLAVLQESAFRICLVTDQDYKILGTITDGDCRRALLRDSSPTLTAGEIMKQNFVMVDTSFSLPQIQALMTTNGILQIPVVDEQRRLVNLVASQSIAKTNPARENWAFILAGGKGTRLLPLTENIPKPMLPVAGKPMLELLVRRLVASGITQIYLSINYLGNQIENYFGDGSNWGATIKYVRESSELGTAGPLSLVRDEVKKPLLVLNGDLVTSVDFAACIDFHQSSQRALTLGVSNHQVRVPFGVVETLANGEVAGISEKPTYSYDVNAGLYVVNPELLKVIPEQQSYSMTDFIERLLALGHKVGAFPLHESWVDVGLPETYHRTKQGQVPAN